MKILEISVERTEGMEDTIIVVGQYNNYVITADQLESLLIDLGLMCADCGDSGEVTTYEAVYPEAGSPTAPIGSAKCHCKKIQVEE